MQSFRLTSFESPPALSESSCPKAGPGDILVKIGACGLNFADILMCQGRYQEMPELPFTLGMELAGTVVEIGEGVSGFSPGDRVAAYAGHGGLAEYAVIPHARCLHLPEAMSLEEAAGFQVAYGSSHLALFHRAKLQAGEMVLVLGAAGGVGLTAVEIAKACGATVIACARGDAKLAIAAKAGADHLIDSDAASDDLKAQFKSFGGINVVYDAIGEPLFTPALRACAPEARYLVIGFAAGQVPQIPANILLVKNIDVIGFWWGGYLKFAPKVLVDSLQTLLDWYSDGRIKPHISHVLPLSQSAEALELLRSRKSTGKVVVTPEASPTSISFTPPLGSGDALYPTDRQSGSNRPSLARRAQNRQRSTGPFDRD